MGPPRRIDAESGLYSLVDGIPFRLPVAARRSPALMAAFSIDARKAAHLLPGNQLHPLLLPNGRSVLMITVVDYTSTNIGRYIEFSIAIGVTHGPKQAPRVLPLIFQRQYNMGQYVYDLPVSSEISVKGGKGIWGMPKHQANLDFRIDHDTVSSQYDLDNQLGMRITIHKPRWTRLPFRTKAANFCQFRGMLMKSTIYFSGDIGVSLIRRPSADLLIGDSPRTAPLKELDVARQPFLTAFLPSTDGILDDHYESWFLGFDDPPSAEPEGLKSVVDLDLSQKWLPPPSCDGRLHDAPRSGPDAA